MANTKYDDRLAALEAQQKLLQEKIKKVKSQRSVAERKKLTNQKIEMGGIIYKILGRGFVEGDKERLSAFLTAQDNRGGFFTKAMNNFPDNESEK